MKKRVYIGFKECKNILDKLVSELKEKLEEKLLGVVLFGSIARSCAKKGSDIDLLIVVEKNSLKIDIEVVKTCTKLELSEQFKEFCNRYFSIPIIPITKDPDELKENPFILLDIIDDGIIMYDKTQIVKRMLDKLKEKLKLLGSKKVYFENGRWMWVLKPDWKPGEVVEIKL